MMPPMPETSHPLHVGVWRTALVAGLAAAALYAGLILSGLTNARAQSDQDLYHAPTIARFARDWPAFDFAGSRSATTPGYHVVLAAASKLGLSQTGLRLAGALFGAGLLSAVVGSLAPRLGARRSLLLALPLACSLPIVASGVWLLPDDAGWLGVAAVLVWCLRDRPPTASRLTIAGLLVLLTVACRQSHLWTAGVVWVWAWSDPTPKRWSRTAIALLCTLPAFALVAWFASIWHGLVPPLFQAGAIDPVTAKPAPANAGVNPAMPVLVLALVAIAGVPMSALLFGSDRPPCHRALLQAGGITLLGAAIGAIPNTSYSVPGRRFGGLWTIAGKLPTVADRSPLMVALAGLGAGVLWLWLLSMPTRARWVLGMSLLGFTAAHAAGSSAFQRYAEPMVLLFVVLAAGSVVLGPATPPRVRRIAWLGPIALAGLLGAVTVSTLR